MIESLTAQEIDRQTAATKKPMKCLGEGVTGPAWLEENPLAINEPMLVSLLADQHHLYRTGKQIRGKTGQIVTPETLKRFIAEEIGPFFPNETARRIPGIYKLLLIYIREGQQNGLKTITASELQQAKIKPPEFVLEKLLPCGLCVLAAPPKTGKSWLCIALADAVASGESFWGRATKQGSVLYMALEDSEYRLKERLKMIDSTMPTNLHLVTRGARKIDDGLIDQIGAWLDSTPDARLVIVDTLARVKGSAAYGLNGYEADTQQFAPLQELAIQRGISLLVVTHLSKAKQFAPEDPFERISGTTGLFGVSDAAWIIYGKRGEEMTLRTTGRDSLDTEYKISLKGVRWEILGESEALEKERLRNSYKSNPIAKTIRKLVQEAKRWEGSASDLQKEVMKETGTLPADSVREFGTQLLEIREQLLTVDGIMFTKGPGGKRGRNYCFEYTNQLATGE